jgi:hypothetical protein
VDKIHLVGGYPRNFEDVSRALTDYDSFTVLTLLNDTSLWLIGVKPQQLSAADFTFA